MSRRSICPKAFANPIDDNGCLTKREKCDDSSSSSSRCKNKHRSIKIQKDEPKCCCPLFPTLGPNDLIRGSVTLLPPNEFNAEIFAAGDPGQLLIVNNDGTPAWGDLEPKSYLDLIYTSFLSLDRPNVPFTADNLSYDSNIIDAKMFNGVSENANNNFDVQLSGDTIKYLGNTHKFKITYSGLTKIFNPDNNNNIETNQTIRIKLNGTDIQRHSILSHTVQPNEEFVTLLYVERIVTLNPNDLLRFFYFTIAGGDMPPPTYNISFQDFNVNIVQVD